MKRKLIKINTVLIRRGKGNLTPLICISGLSLNAYGFEVGRRFEVYAQKDQLVLKAKEFKYKNPIIKEDEKK